MGKVIDFNARLQRKAEEAKEQAVAYEDAFLTVTKSGVLTYKQRGIEEFEEVFSLAGVEIEEITTLEEHAEVLERIRIPDPCF